jgi:hypothetical protein
VNWPESFYKIRRGVGCPMCAEGRPEVSADGVRFYAGRVADAYLRRSGIQRGLTWSSGEVATSPSRPNSAMRKPTNTCTSC